LAQQEQEALNLLLIANLLLHKYSLTFLYKLPIFRTDVPSSQHSYKNAQIAQRLVVSEKTVCNHVSNILSKLQVADRAQATIRAKAAGLGWPMPPSSLRTA
jgi:hypothetical protein